MLACRKLPGSNQARLFYTIVKMAIDTKLTTVFYYTDDIQASYTADYNPIKAKSQYILHMCTEAISIQVWNQDGRLILTL